MGHPETPGPEFDPKSFLEDHYAENGDTPWFSRESELSISEYVLRLQEIAIHLLGPDEIAYTEQLDEYADVHQVSEYIKGRLTEFGYEYRDVFERYGILEQNDQTE